MATEIVSSISATGVAVFVPFEGEAPISVSLIGSDVVIRRDARPPQHWSVGEDSFREIALRKSVLVVEYGGDGQPSRARQMSIV